MTASVGTIAPRLLIHPGPPAPERLEVAPTRIVPLAGMLAPGTTVLDALAALVDASGCAGGMIEMRGGGFASLRFVIPAEATDGIHAVYYSQTHAPEGAARLVRAWCSLGWRDGARFVHCHGQWRTGDGRLAMGHLLPDETIVGEAIAVTGFGTLDATFVAALDDETRFTLFSVEPIGDAAPACPPAALVRLRPNVDPFVALDEAIATCGIVRGTVYGIGSMTDLHFDDGSTLRSIATEVMLTASAFSTGRTGGGVQFLELAGVGTDGTIASSRLDRSGNVVCVTAELLIVGEASA